jgi:phenylacetate-CoA ligase
VRRTRLSQLTLYALGMRAHTWFKRDLSLPLAVVRADSPLMDDDVRARELGWGHPASLLFATGPGYSLPISSNLADQAAWLIRRNPGYLLTYPTNLGALLEHFAARRPPLPALREVRTVGETVSAALRARCREVLGVPVVDGYSSQEVGVIALECPVSGLYHLQSESLIVEVLDAAGRPCSAGSVGRVVVTDLHNFATPLIRYDLGDRAEVGPACSCGRGLPTLSRILGRERNLVALPNGERHWPLVGLHEYRAIGPILQYQIVQRSLELIEMRLVVEGGALDADREQRLTRVVQRALGHPFRLEFRYFEAEIPRGPGGKYEEFVSLV